MVSLRLLVFISVVCGSQANHFAGPFMIWGMNKLQPKISTLQPINDQNLREMFSKASAICIFIRNSTTALSDENFPKLSAMVGKQVLYLPQESLPSNPLEYNINVEVLTLTGSPAMQDDEIVAFYRNAQIGHEHSNVLGILATNGMDHLSNLRLKRESKTATTEPTDSITESASSGEEPIENLIYLAQGKGILYTTVVPILRITNKAAATENSYELRKHAIATADERGDTFSLSVKFIVAEKMIFIKFVFKTANGRWTLNQAEYDSKVLEIIGTPPSAKIGESYACAGTIIFVKENISLQLKAIQVQPLLNGSNKFGKAVDCVGYATSAILSGTFVSAILLVALTIALIAIMDIKAPNRFESRSSKQLSFTIQE